jgi:uncharacterized protein (UPF0332 family)
MRRIARRRSRLSVLRRRRVDSKLFAAVRRLQEIREAADYDAREISADEAEEILSGAESFVARVATMLEA